MIEIKVKKELSSVKETFKLDVDITIKNREFITIFGKSGVGKTSLLKIIAGLIQVDYGFIKINDQIWLDTEKNINLPPQKRKIGFVFQDFALFPNMTVEQNIAFAMAKKDKNFLKKVLEVTEIENIKHKKPDTLSGGQKQKVALARAIARKPTLLLLDEPFSSLDLETRQKLQEELKKIHDEFNLTTILVSHDFSEIFRLSDRVFLLEKGKIKKHGKPEDIFIQEKLSGKVKLTGQILNIEKEDIMYIITVLIGNNVIKIVAVEEEIKELNIGDNVIIATKGFNPFVLRTM
ncbi:MAG: ATP-binding cassette domain-containing protein [Aquificae bacterium]|nr:ATP-binding cassette domain-containing protein [Aquificota bacterium]